jgi:hypothetical protein
MVWTFWKRFLGLMEPAADSESLADGLDGEFSDDF